MRLSPLLPSLCALALWAGGAGWAEGAEADSPDTQTKAERLSSLAYFVDWPEKRFPRPDSPLVIGIWGDDAIVAPLLEIVQGRRIKGHPVVVRYLTLREELPSCHVLFFSRSETSRVEALLRSVRREGVLSVGETETFLTHGGVMSLLKVGDTYRLQVSGEAVKRERLVVSSKLLQLALPPNFQSGGSPPRNPAEEH